MLTVALKSGTSPASDDLALFEPGGSVTIPPGPRLIGLQDFARYLTHVGTPVIQSHFSSISDTIVFPEPGVAAS
jgi:hypothetical protein